MTKKNDNEAEKFARELQDRVMQEIRRTYSPAVIDHWQNPRGFRRMEAAEGYAKNTGTCGDTLEIFLRVKDETITECTFQTDGCGTTIVCGSVATELVAGKPFIEALGAVSAAEILRVLGGLPDESIHCAQLAAETLRRALADYLYQKSAPWKKNYRKT